MYTYKSITIWLAVLFILAAGLCLAHGTITAALLMHQQLIANVLRQPMSWFDTTPTGRILARFSSDLSTCDHHLPMYLKQFVLNFLRVCVGVG